MPHHQQQTPPNHVQTTRPLTGLPLTQLYRQMFNKDLYLVVVDRTTGRHAGDG
jgi:hypothetical protein